MLNMQCQHVGDGKFRAENAEISDSESIPDSKDTDLYILTD